MIPQLQLTVLLDEQVAQHLAVFAQRADLSTFARFTDAHLSNTDREEQAHLMRAGMIALAQALSAHGLTGR